MNNFLKKIFKKISARKSGFTLIEALVAISILAISVIGAFSVAQRGLQSSFFARDQMVAFYLAQEAIELVKNTRHTNILNENENWLAGVSFECSNLCIVESFSGLFSSVQGSMGDLTLPIGSRLFINENNGFYTHNSNSNNLETRFRRVLKVNEVAINDGSDRTYAEVTARVQWRHGTGLRDFEMTEFIFEWHE